jgi:hypothetical protein
LQKKYTDEQRKEVYLNQLSRKSVKSAEVEVTELDQVLESVGRTRENLDKETKALKQKLKLINRAKYFVDD